MKYFKYLILFVILQSCNKSVINLGQSFVLKKSSNEKMFIPSGELVTKVDTIIDQISYTLGIKDDKIVFISSLDEKLTEIKNVKDKKLLELKTLTSDTIEKIAGWGYYLSLENGWYAGYDIKEPLNDNKKADWYFQYSFPQENKSRFKSIQSN